MKKNKLLNTIELLILAICICYFVYTIFFIKENQLFNIICSFLITFFVAMIFMQQITNKNIYKNVSLLILILFISSNILNSLNVFAKNIEIVDNLTGKTLNEVLPWAEKNNIKVEQIYEYSDNICELCVISQNVSPTTPINEISEIKLIISLGPNYDKIVVIPNLVGLKITDLQNTINELLLNNIDVEYVDSDLEKDTILEQSLKGQYSRNTKIVFKISNGNEIIENITMIDLIKKSLFDATLWLKQNKIKYEITYEFNEQKRNTILNQSIKENETININNDKIILTVSKGKSITVPNLLKMNNEEIINWITDNNLKIEFTEEYSTTIPLGTTISSNYKENDIIEDGTIIKIVTSKGQIIYPKLTTLQEIKNWANQYNINVNEEYTTSNDITKGNIINSTYKENDIVDPKKTISVTISTGKPITVPNFYNMDKASITAKCQSLQLNCSFYESNYSNSVAYGKAIAQNVAAGTIVTNGKYISIGLSKGSPKTFTLKLPQATIASCIGDANCTINFLKTYLSSNYPNITFTFEIQSSSTYNNAGFIHENSGKIAGTVNDNSNVTQGNTYKILITK